MSTRIIRARAPLRLGPAGGGTDVSPFSDDHGGFVLNASGVGQACGDEEPLRLHRGIVQQFNGGRPLSLRLSTYADAPAGSGLGTSSTMVVCILQAYSEWLQLGLGEYEIAQLGYQIERLDLALAGGKQDHYAAAFGGFNFIEFGVQDRVLVNPLRVKDWVINELEACTVLYYTGQSRESAHIIQRQVDNTRAGKVDPRLPRRRQIRRSAPSPLRADTLRLVAHVRPLDRGRLCVAPVLDRTQCSAFMWASAGSVAVQLQLCSTRFSAACSQGAGSLGPGHPDGAFAPAGRRAAGRSVGAAPGPRGRHRMSGTASMTRVLFCPPADRPSSTIRRCARPGPPPVCWPRRARSGETRA